MSTYLWIDLGTLLLPFLFSFHPRLRFHEHWPAFAIGLLVMMALFIPWDVCFTVQRVWGFAPEQVSSTRLLHLPLEEWLFFLCIPYACVFTYQAWGALGLPVLRPAAARTAATTLGMLLLVIGLGSMQHAYTATTSLLLGTWLLIVSFLPGAAWLGRFLAAYAVLLLPFLVVDGLLTRSVVWYDDAETLGLRIGTIPVEDVGYGLLMVGLVVTVYELIEHHADRTADR